MSLVYNANAEFKTPDEEIAADLLRKVRSLKSVRDRDERDRIINLMRDEAVSRCLERHMLDNCLECVKFAECFIHQFDVEYAKGEF